jgi:hypothetical protein
MHSQEWLCHEPIPAAQNRFGTRRGAALTFPQGKRKDKYKKH